MSSSHRPTTLFWVLAIILVLWNLMGAASFITDNFFPELIAAAYTPEQMQAIESSPLWARILYGIATLGGLLAAILLLARKRLAVRIYLISLLAVVIHTLYQIAFANGLEIFGIGQGLIFPMCIVILSVFEYWWSRYSASMGWLS